MKKKYLLLILILFSSCFNEEHKKLEQERKTLDSIDRQIKVLEEEIKLHNDSIYKNIINNVH